MRIPAKFLLVTALTLALAAQQANAQFGGFDFFRPIQNFLKPVMRFFGGGPKFRDDGTQTPQATGRDALFPDDCGRDEDQGTGKLCFPDGKLCEERVNKGGVQRFNGHLYWFSWQDNDGSVRNAKWDWFNARNYCRKRCMDLVSFETQQEYDWVKGFIDGGVQFFWTSGRKCNFDGCDKPEFFPKLINGWFWSANQVKMPPTNGNQFHDWSHTGGNGVAQPDDREHRQGGEEEACMAVLNNFYGDGIKWHDVACHHEKPIICEDEPGHLRHILGKK